MKCNTGKDIDLFKKRFEEIKYQVVDKLIKKNIKISTCESATAGALASNICDVPGSSNILSEAYIVYSIDAKQKILDLSKEIIEKYGVVSKECAKSMAEKLYNISKADICISVTGNLGPDVLENKNVGLVYVGILYKGEMKIKEYRFNHDRLGNKFMVIYNVFNEIYEMVK